MKAYVPLCDVTMLDRVPLSVITKRFERYGGTKAKNWKNVRDVFK